MVSSSKSKQQRRQAAIAQATKKHRDINWFTILVSGFVILAVVAVGGFLFVQSQADSAQSSVAASKVSPKNVVNDGYTITKDGIVDAEAYKINTKLAPSPYESEDTNISIYIDYACPHCAEFEEANIEQIENWVDSGEVTSLTIHPIAFLSTYSVEGANALACVANYSPENVFAAHKAMTSAHETAPSGRKLVTLLQNEANAPKTDTFTKCVRGGQFDKFVEESTKRAQKGPIPNTALAETAGITGTPTIFVNGEKYPGNPANASDFKEYVAFIKGGGKNADIDNSVNPNDQSSIGGN